MGIKNLVLLSPYFRFQTSNFKAKEITKYFNTITLISNSINKSAKKLNISIEESDLNNMTKEDVSKFNEYSSFSLWMYEITTGLNGIMTETDKYINKENYTGTKQYTAYTGISFSRGNPFYFMIIYDLLNGNIAYSYENKLNKISRDYISSNIYNSLYYINKYN